MEFNHFSTAKRIIALFERSRKEPQLIEYCSITTATMSNTTFNRKNRTKKGISPVIATVILVAVAVVIAAALAGFASSLFGTYAGAGGAVAVESVEVHVDGTGQVVLVNGGQTSDSITSIQVMGENPFNVEPNVDIAAGGSETIPAALGELGTFTADEVGKPITVRVNLESGTALSYSTTLLN
jgi:flagellin-like protein